MNKLTFETLTPYEKLMLKDMAHKIYRDNRSLDAPMSVVEATFYIINAMGYDIIKTDRESTVKKNK